MKEYSNIKALCVKHSQLCERAIDNFLMHFIAAKGGVTKKIELAERKYKHIIREMPKAFFSKASAEFIVGKALMKDGLLNKYLHHPMLYQLPIEEQEYLKFQLSTPWRYVFGRIVERPENEFFIIRDEILGDELLVYSPGIEVNCKNGHEHSLYFLLLGNNGECWQTFGLIAPFLSFDLDDIYIYATEVFTDVVDDESFMKSVYANPFPYFMLLYGQEMPKVMGGNTVLKHHVAEQEITDLETFKVKEHFKVQWNKGIFQFSLDEWNRSPHFAATYFIEKENLLFRYAMTKEGFNAMTNKLCKAGLTVPIEEDYSVGLSMVNTMNRILKRDLSINPYEKHFSDSNKSNISNEERDRINNFLGLLIPFINSGAHPDLVQLASGCGISLKEAQEIYQTLRSKYSNL